MHTRNAVILSFVLAVLLSTNSILRLPKLLPLHLSAVRHMASEQVAYLQSEGYWLVTVDIQSIQRIGNGYCFTWREEYRSRDRTYPASLIKRCNDL